MIDNHIVGTAQQDFSLAVAVPVVAHSIVLFVRTAHHVRTKVDIPQSVTLDVVTFQQVEVSSVYRTEIVNITFHDKFAHAVAVNIGQCDVVDGVPARNVITIAVGHVFHGKLDILLTEARHLLAFLLLFAAYHSSHLVFRACLALAIHVVRHLERTGYLRTVTIQVVLRVVVLLAENPPAHERARARGNSHESAVQFVGSALCRHADTHEHGNSQRKKQSFHLKFIVY